MLLQRLERRNAADEECFPFPTCPRSGRRPVVRLKQAYLSLPRDEPTYSKIRGQTGADENHQHLACNGGNIIQVKYVTAREKRERGMDL